MRNPTPRAGVRLSMEADHEAHLVVLVFDFHGLGLRYGADRYLHGYESQFSGGCAAGRDLGPGEARPNHPSGWHPSAHETGQPSAYHVFDPGSGVYLETAFPVVANNRVVIPEHTRVMGVVADERRPGRVKGRSQMRLRFTQMILPDNRGLSIVGQLQSLPGSNSNRAVDKEGTLEPVDQIDADVYTVAGGAIGGGIIGSVGHFGIGTGRGALLGGGLGLAKVLFTRGDEISLPVGTRVEMVLQRPLTVQPAPR